MTPEQAAELTEKVRAADALIREASEELVRLRAAGSVAEADALQLELQNAKQQLDAIKAAYG